MFRKFIFLLLVFNLLGCLEQNDVVYVYLSQSQGKLVTKVNGSVAKNFDAVGDKLSYFFKDKRDDTDLYIIFKDGVAFSDARNIVGLAQAIGYSNIKLYTLTMETEKMQEIERDIPVFVPDNILSFIGAK
jgi:hypothetical protein